MAIKNITDQKTNNPKERLQGLKNIIEVVISINTSNGNHMEIISMLMQCKKELEPLDQLGIQI